MGYELTDFSGKLINYGTHASLKIEAQAKKLIHYFITPICT